MPDKKWAIFSVDPGETTGVCAAHLYNDDDHEVIHRHWTATYTTADYPPPPRKLDPTAPLQPYHAYYRLAKDVMLRYMAFRKAAVGHYSIPTQCCSMVIEDWHPFRALRSTKREVISGLIIAQHLYTMLHEAAWWYEYLAFGPAHVAPIVWVQPADKAMWERPETRREMKAAQLLQLPASQHEHENDATTLMLVRARQLGVSDLLERPGKRDDPETIWAQRPFSIPYSGPSHEAKDPLDPSRRRPRPGSRRARRKRGIGLR